MPLRRISFSLSFILSLASLSVAQNTESDSATASEQASPEDASVSQKKFAFQLMNGQHQLEALPLFESLMKQRPEDGEVLFGYGACLFTHSATMPDNNESRQERIKARKLLLRAKEKGVNSLLLGNLLDSSSDDGTILHDPRPEVDKAIQDGEIAFAKNNYTEALQDYQRAFQLDPHNYSAALYVADAYFATKDDRIRTGR